MGIGNFGITGYQLRWAASDLENSTKQEWFNECSFREETKEEINKAILILKQAAIYLNRIDHLIDDDDNEETFYKQLQEELVALEKEQCNDKT